MDEASPPRRLPRLLTLQKPNRVSKDHYLEFVAIQVSSLFSLLAHLVLLALYQHYQLWPMAAFSVMSVLLWSAAIFANRRGEHLISVVLACSELCGYSIAAVYFLGLEFGFQYYLWPTTCLAIVNSRQQVLSASLTGLACIGLFLVLNLLFPGSRYDGGLLEWSRWLFSANVILAAAPLILSVILVRRQFERQRRDLVELATRDELTQLYNRRYLREFLHPWRAQARRTGASSVIAIGDIDNFKPINDELGHDVGDDVLKGVAAFLLDQVREEDLVCRWGGEEFVIIFASTSLAQAERILRRLHEAMPQQRFMDNDRSVTISFGVTDFKADEDMGDALARADQLLYRAKAGGRNRIEAALESS
ncbi:GGDEF domain-containing protein [Saccharospirillum mangrovi]|uniref:GGDEF domain-containing protein n=1 Tax=Saccharospirillum mangrovi TaxID=2161747 RepID=UPI000D3D63FC|nr:GGDEF domain-containing protein [Saccharospirillum mangrovi]